MKFCIFILGLVLGSALAVPFGNYANVHYGSYNSTKGSYQGQYQPNPVKISYQSTNKWGTQYQPYNTNKYPSSYNTVDQQQASLSYPTNYNTGGQQQMNLNYNPVQKPVTEEIIVPVKITLQHDYQKPQNPFQQFKPAVVTYYT